ncbi:methionine--tRNA ligase, mitochondrial [Neocloeon triangulifer]|uniref:methionine--tRNA ligase, mitochondrial n=1 Tax=Neocloeon triangulifer TaxID=2078957 RepID=UPI00286F7DB9|nr:methionine--tRNA ligase, mitochondrial [Neocloeon triangulifer]
MERVLQKLVHSSRMLHFLPKRRCLSNLSNKNFFITTPIFYVNASPHLGHLYTSLVADAAQRFQHLVSKSPSFLSTGTDEHGSKVQKAAGKIDTQLYCDQISNQYVEMLEMYGVDFSKFVRTTSTEHKRAVQAFWKKLEGKNLIYTGDYSGWYCEADEAFVPETRTEKLSDGARISSESGRPVEWTSEQNFLFKISAVKDDLLHWLKDKHVIQPRKFHDLVQLWVGEGFHDVSITRPSHRVPWGIPVPDHPGHSIYVWMDALINYLTVAGFPDTLQKWPVDVHVIGKDILRFHAILWPSLLIAAGLEPPKQIHCHSHWKVDSEKMSKSRGNVIDPRGEIRLKFTAEGLRYFLLREGTNHSDANFSETKVFNILNAELAGKLGNLLNRCTGKSLNPKQVWPVYVSGLVGDQYLVEALRELPDKTKQHYEDFNFYKAVDEVILVLQEANKFFEDQKPWTLQRDSAEMHSILSLTLETLRVVGIVLQPVIPKLTGQLLEKLDVPLENRYWADLKTFVWDKTSAEKTLQSQKLTLFPRLGDGK